MMNSVASLPQINPRIEFWSLRGAAWPRDWHRHVFAGRVVHKTGQLLYGRHWTFEEPETVLIHPLPARLDAGMRQDELTWAISLLIRNYSPYAEKAKAAIAADQRPPLPEPDEWQFAVGLSHQLSNESHAALARFRRVVDFLVSLLERGILKAALRPFLFGEPEDLPAGAWYNEAYMAWFATCQIDLERPFSGIAIREGGHWIVFDKATFDAWVRSVEKYAAASAQKDEQGAEVKPVKHAEDVQTQNENAVVSDDVTKPSSQPAEASHCDPVDAAPPPIEGAATIVNRSKRKAGAKGKWPWNDGPFEKKLKELMTADVKPTSLNALNEEMLSWCLHNWGDEPGKTQLDKEIRVRLAQLGLKLP